MKLGVSAHLPPPQRQKRVAASRAPLVIGGLLATAARRKRVAACVKWLGDAWAAPTTLRCEPDEKPAEDTGRAVNWDSNAVLVYFAKF